MSVTSDTKTINADLTIHLLTRYIDSATMFASQPLCFTNSYALYVFNRDIISVISIQTTLPKLSHKTVCLLNPFKPGTGIRFITKFMQNQNFYQLSYQNHCQGLTLGITNTKTITTQLDMGQNYYWQHTTHHPSPPTKNLLKASKLILQRSWVKISYFPTVS